MVSATLMVSGTGEGMAASRRVVTPGADQRPPVTGPFGGLTDVVIQRLRVGDQVAAAKFGTGKPIDDPAREAQELAQVRQDAVTVGIDPDATVRFFQDQIAASKVVQRGLFALWTAHPDLAPVVRPDLTAIRTELDALTTELLRQLVRVRDVQRGPLCRVRLAEAKVTGEIFERLDRLHRRALSVALASVCP
ncbi:chorismate mutase [Amycolatopsis pigmentata]|uniref:chorismate mutase n=1 Tax=Amycolatopsis pigmentata TaxID=450801 RepID=A0ABW5FR66_9PSEU